MKKRTQKIIEMDLILSILSPIIIIMIIIMEICKAPTLQLKALNKHTHIMYIEMENVTKKYIHISTRVQG